MPGTIDMVPLGIVVSTLWLLTMVCRARSYHHLYPVFRRALLTAVIVGIVVFCWNVVWALL
jgi:hypothetical protein